MHDLDAVDQFRWTLAKNEFPDMAVVAMRTRDALRRYGADPDAVPTDDAASRVSASVVRERIVSALDRLLVFSRREDRTKASAEKPKVYTPQPRGDVEALLPKTARVRDVLRRVDAERYRDAVRDAVVAGDRAKFVELAIQAAAPEQPAGFAAFLGEVLDIGVERRRELLQAAVSRRPGDLGLLMTLGGTYPFDKKEGVDERLRWYQAAVAAAPANAAGHTGLGLALQDKGQLDAAIACYRKAIELDPKEANGHYNLGIALLDTGQLDEATARFRKAIELDPKHAKAHDCLGIVLQNKGQLDEGIACFKKAIELDPKYAGAHNNLGIALNAGGQLDEAIACHRKAIEVDPTLALAHYNLGIALLDKGQPEEAIACHRKAIELDPKNASVHYNLGIALWGTGQLDEAISCFKKTIELDPKFARAHNNLGNALKAKGQLDEAIACYRRAIELDPKDANGHYNLGNALRDKGQLDEAIGCFEKAIELSPKYAEAHCNMGLVLARQRRFAVALTALHRGHELGAKQPGWRYPSAKWVAEAERGLAQANRLPAVLRGEDKPGDNAECLAFAQLAFDRKNFAAAARLWSEALTADLKLADDRKVQHRYNAACAAALAASGAGKDDPPPDGAAKARLRLQALDWLKAEMFAWAKLVESGPPQAKSFIAQTLKHWRDDPDLAGLREEKQLAKVPEEERAALKQLWNDVDGLLIKVGERK